MMELADADYSAGTQNSLLWLVNHVELILGRKEFTKRYGKTPVEARSSGAHDKSKHIIAWSLVTCDNYLNLPSGTLTKARLDSFKQVISDRKAEASKHEKLASRSYDGKELDSKHTHSISVLQKALQNLSWAEEQSHPKAPSRRGSITTIKTGVEPFNLAKVGRLDMFSGVSTTAADEMHQESEAGYEERQRRRAA